MAESLPVPRANAPARFSGGSFAAGLAALPARAAAGLVRLYQLTLSPALLALNPACGCRFSPSCSHYARAAFVEHGFIAGAFLAARRLVRCGPWHPGGDDPVPLSSRRRLTCRAVAPARLLVPPASPLS